MLMSEVGAAVALGEQAEAKEKEQEVLDADDAALAGDNDSESQLKISEMGEEDIDRLLAPDTEGSDVKGSELSAEDLLGSGPVSANISEEQSQGSESTEMADSDKIQPSVDEFKPIDKTTEGPRDLTMEDFFGGISAAALISEDSEEIVDDLSSKKTTEGMESTDMDDDIVFVESEKNVLPDDIIIAERNIVSSSVPCDNDVVFLSDDEDLAHPKETPKASIFTSEIPKHRQMHQILRYFLECKKPEEQAIIATRLDIQKVKLDVLAAEDRIKDAVNDFNLRSEFERTRMQEKLDIANRKIQELERQLQQKSSGSFSHHPNGQFNGNMMKHRFATRSIANSTLTHFSNGNHVQSSSYRAIAPRRAPSTSSFSNPSSSRGSTPAHSRPTLAVPAVPSMIPTSTMKTKISILVDQIPATPSGVHDPFDAKPLPEFPPGVNRLPRDGVDVVLKTEYENFLLTKKVHGLITYPTTFSNPDGKVVRLYYWIESMHKAWHYSDMAQISSTGATKFALSFDSTQKLYSGDRITFIAYVFMDQMTKYASDRVVFKFRPPPGFRRSTPNAVIDLQ